MVSSRFNIVHSFANVQIFFLSLLHQLCWHLAQDIYHCTIPFDVFFCWIVLVAPLYYLFYVYGQFKPIHNFGQVTIYYCVQFSLIHLAFNIAGAIIIGLRTMAQNFYCLIQLACSILFIKIKQCSFSQPFYLRAPNLPSLTCASRLLSVSMVNHDPKG